MQLLGKNTRQLRQDVLSSWGGKVCKDTHMFIIRPPLNVCLPAQLILQREGSLKHRPVSGSHYSDAHTYLWMDAPPVTDCYSSSHSENYLVRWGSKGFPKEIEMLNNLKVVFTVSVCSLSTALYPPSDLALGKRLAGYCSGWSRAPHRAVLWAFHGASLLVESLYVLRMSLDVEKMSLLLCSLPLPCLSHSVHTDNRTI